MDTEHNSSDVPDGPAGEPHFRELGNEVDGWLRQVDRPQRLKSGGPRLARAIDLVADAGTDRSKHSSKMRRRCGFRKFWPPRHPDLTRP